MQLCVLQAKFALPPSMTLGTYTLSVAVTNGGSAGGSKPLFVGVSTFVSPAIPRRSTLVVRAPLKFKAERFVVERPPPGKQTPTCKGDYGTMPGSRDRAFDSTPAVQAALAKASKAQIVTSRPFFKMAPKHWTELNVVELEILVSHPE